MKYLLIFLVSLSSCCFPELPESIPNRVEIEGCQYSFYWDELRVQVFYLPAIPFRNKAKIEVEAYNFDGELIELTGAESKLEEIILNLDTTYNLAEFPPVPKEYSEPREIYYSFHRDAKEKMRAFENFERFTGVPMNEAKQIEKTVSYKGKVLYKTLL